MLARLNSIVRAIRIGIARKLRRPGRGELLYMEGVFGCVLQARRAIGTAAVVGAAGWVVLGASAALHAARSFSVDSPPCTGARSAVARAPAGCAGSGQRTCSDAGVPTSPPPAEVAHAVRIDGCPDSAGREKSPGT